MKKQFMLKVKGYSDLNKQVKIMRANKEKAEDKITTKHSQLNLNMEKPVIKSCINLYNSVIDENGPVFMLYFVYCDLFKPGEVCVNRKCPMFADQMDYVAACEKVMQARAARKQYWRKEILGLRK